MNLTISSHTTDLVQQVFSGKWPINMILSRITGDLPQDISALMTPAAFFNIEKVDDPKIDSLLAAAQSATDANKAAAYTALAQYTAQQAWFIAPVVQQTVTAYNPKTVKVTPPPFGAIFLYDYQRP